MFKARIIAIILSLVMVLAAMPVVSFAQQPLTVYVRIEAPDTTLLTRTAVDVNYFALSNYGISGGEPGVAVGFHALVQVLKDIGQNLADPNVFGVSASEWGTFLTDLLGVSPVGDYTWMFLVNNTDPWMGLDTYPLQHGDELVIYCFNWNGMAVFFDEQHVTVAAGQEFELTLKGDLWGTTIDAVPDATILISELGGNIANIETNHITDEYGRVTISIDEPGEYVLSATRLSECGTFIDISRPYSRVIVTDGAHQQADKTALNALILQATALTAASYTEASWQVVLRALTAARVVSREATSTQLQVDFAVDSLEQAINALVEAIPLPPTDVTEAVETALEAIAGMYAQVPNQAGIFLSDWQAFGLSAYGQSDLVQNAPAFAVNSFRNAYNNGNYWVLDVQRSAIALTSLGINARATADGEGNLADLIYIIANHPARTLGTFNAYIFALLAYDSGGYQLPANAVWTREVLVENILSAQNANGGWAIVSGRPSQIEFTAMAITALSGYADNLEVAAAINRGVSWLFANQHANGGFGDSSEFSAQVIVALCALGINPTADNRFTRGGNNPVTHLLSYRMDNGMFRHTSRGAANAMATEQAFYALAAYDRMTRNGGSAVNIFRFGYVDVAEPIEVAISATNIDEIILPQTLVTLEPGATVLNAAVAALSRAGIAFEENSSKILSINGVEGFHFCIDGVIYDITKAEFSVADGAVINIYRGSADRVFVGSNPVQVSFHEAIESPGFNMAAGVLLPSISANYAGIELDIHQGTAMVAPADYNGVFVMPNTTTAVLAEDQILVTAVDSGRFAFSRPVRLFIPGAAAQMASYLNEAGQFVPISLTLAEDSIEAAETAGATTAKIVTDRGVVIWTTQLSTFATYRQAHQDAEGTVYISVKDPNPNGEAREFLMHGGFEYFNGMTVIDLLEATGLQIETDASGNYVRQIEDLAEFDEGPLSGWLFRINGELGQQSARSYVLNPSDYVEWLFTRELGEDLDGSTQENSDEAVTTSTEQPTQTLPQPQTSLADVSAMINAAIERNAREGNHSDWAEFGNVLNGGQISNSRFVEIGEEIQTNEGNFRLATDLARVSILLRTAGYDLTYFYGVNLIEAVYNNQNMGRQGTNGYIFSLIVLTGEYVTASAAMPIDAIINNILAAQNEDGGFALAVGVSSNADITAMAVSALAPYRDNESVELAINSALKFLENTHLESAETLAQVVIALSALGQNPDEARFMQNEKTLMQNLLEYRTPDGGFAHQIGGASDDIATEHGLLAMLAYVHYFRGWGSIYKSHIVSEFVYISEDGFTLPNDMRYVSGWAVSFVQEAFARGIAAGDQNGNFNPQSPVTRAEFVAMFMNFLGKVPTDDYSGAFTDVNATDWFVNFVETAANLGIISGVGYGYFAPNAPITRQDVAVIVANYYNLHSDYLVVEDEADIAEYARVAIAAVMQAEIMNGVGNGFFAPQAFTTREMAVAILINIEH